jgi:hypothetical protein
MRDIKEFEDVLKIPMWEEIKINENTTITKVQHGYLYTKYGYYYEAGTPYVKYDKPILMVFAPEKHHDCEHTQVADYLRGWASSL